MKATKNIQLLLITLLLITQAGYSQLTSPCDLSGGNGQWFSGVGKIFTCSNTKVGVGTDTPRVALDVRSTSYLTNLAIGADPLSMQGKLHIKTTSQIVNSPILLIENNTQRLLYLDNTGLLRSREIKIDGGLWPDYVFEDDYNLKTLNEVETFIKAKKHLPNVPSAEYVANNGQDLGEMNRILLEKIEELTLYLIEQDKRIKVLELQIEKE